MNYRREEFDAKVKDKNRLIFKIGDNLHNVIWFQLAKDGSIYTGMCDEVNAIHLSKKEIVPNENIFVKYGESDSGAITDEEFLKRSKHTFHPSGVKHIGTPSEEIETRQFWKNIKDIEKSENVCNYIFKNIVSYGKPAALRKTDVIIEYPLESGYPICCNINIMPLENIKHIELNSRYQHTAFFIYEDVPGLKPVAIEVIFYHNNKGSYPPRTVSFYKAEMYNPPKESDQ